MAAAAGQSDAPLLRERVDAGRTGGDAMTRMVGKACVGALLGVLVVFAGFFVAAFFVVVDIAPVVQWLMVVVVAAAGFVVGLLWPDKEGVRVVDQCRICGRDLKTGVQLMPLPLLPGDIPARDELCDGCAARCGSL
jgi:hypothetical protein